MQAGDGRLGLIVQSQAFTSVTRRFMIFAGGTYLVTPYGTNGVRTFRTRPTEGYMSVADQYLFSAGGSYAVLPRYGLGATLAGRLEGIPPRDLVGSSTGFRRPGLIVSVEPGVVFSRGAYTFTFSVPVAMHRERQRSVPNEQDGSHGDAAFADYAIVVGHSLRF